MQRIRLALIALALCCLAQQRPEREWKARGRILMAATVHTWTNGTADGSWATVGNWSSGALPGSGGIGLDDAVFDGNVTQTGPSAGMDRTADNELHRIVVRPNFTGNIGASGNPLIHTLNTAADDSCYILHRGTGSFYFKNTATGGSDFIMDGSGAAYLDCGAAAIIRALFIKRGTVTAASSCSLSQLVVLDGPSAILTVAAKAAAESDPDWILVQQGTYTNNRVISADNHAIVFAGMLDQRGVVDDDAVLITGPAGVIKYTPNTALGVDDNPTIVTFGQFDTSDSNQAIAPSRYIVGQLGNILGTAVQSATAYVDIDLREDYP